VPFRHVALYRFADHVDDEHRALLGSALDELRDQIPGVRAVTHGADAGMVGGGYDYVVVIDVGTAADWRTVADHPSYILLAAELLTPHVVEQASAQFRIDEPAAVGPTDVDVRDLSDDELMEQARRSAQASMEALLAEPDDRF
jgi:hypothetical protein